MGRPAGLDGSMHVQLHNPASQVLQRGPRLILRLDALETAFSVEGARRAGKSWVLRLCGVLDRDAAASWTGAAVLAPRSELRLQRADGEWFAFELEGLTAILKDGTTIGIVKAIANFGAGDLLVIQRSSGDDWILPFAEPFVGAVDLAARSVEICDWEQELA